MTRLDLELIVRKTSWQAWLAALLVAIAAAIDAFGTGTLAHATQARLADLHALGAAPAPSDDGAPPMPLVHIRYGAFVAVLEEKADTHHVIRSLFRAAERHALGLAQADYALAFDEAGKFWTYRVDLPLSGPYGSLRRFVDEVLRAIPCAALEQIDFKRDGVGAASVEARMRFVLYLKDGAA